jgi:sugar phosphate isomerase/epimerase
MRVGLFTDALGNRPLADALAWIGAELPDVRDVEIGTGGYSPAPHCDRGALLADDRARAEWLETIEAAGFRLVALNVSGNPLEDPAHDAALRETVRLAPLLGVDRVVCMSGGDARLSGGGWFPGIDEDTERYWEARVVPYWRGVLVDAGAVLLCFELEPGNAVFNVSTFERLAELGDESIAVNLDPSHFFWQGIDPLAAVRRLGGRVGFAHAKDTVLDGDRLVLDGLLARDRSWRYAAVGRGHDLGWWRSFADALARAGYDGVLSIEVEDPRMPPEEAARESAELLVNALEKVPL